MPVKIAPANQIKARLGLEVDGRVQKFFTNTCYKHMDKYVPFDEGNLATIVDIQSSWITYEMPYASYQYYGVRKDGTHPINEANRNRNYHPLATSYWDKKMVSAEMQDVVKEVQKELNRGGRR